MPNPLVLKQLLFGEYINEDKQYPQPLTSVLAPWYCYTIDGGHSLVVAIASRYAPQVGPEHFLVPIPVKTVLRGYEQRDGYILVDIPYDSIMGAMAPEDDEEF